MATNPLGKKRVLSASTLTDPEDNTRQGGFDNLLSVPIFISSEHHEIHEGDAYLLPKEVALNNGDVYDFLFIPPINGKQIHMNWELTGDDKFKVEFYENPTVTANGTDITSSVLNRNRNSIETTSSTVYSQPTVTSTGTSLHCAYTDKYTPTRVEGELVLGETNTYLLRIVALKDSASICVSGNWYEHLPQ